MRGTIWRAKRQAWEKARKTLFEKYAETWAAYNAGKLQIEEEVAAVKGNLGYHRQQRRNIMRVGTEKNLAKRDKALGAMRKTMQLLLNRAAQLFQASTLYGRNDRLYNENNQMRGQMHYLYERLVAMLDSAVQAERKIKADDSTWYKTMWGHMV